MAINDKPLDSGPIGYEGCHVKADQTLTWQRKLSHPCTWNPVHIRHQVHRSSEWYRGNHAQYNYSKLLCEMPLIQVLNSEQHPPKTWHLANQETFESPHALMHPSGQIELDAAHEPN